MGPWGHAWALLSLFLHLSPWLGRKAVEIMWNLFQLYPCLSLISQALAINVWKARQGAVTVTGSDFLRLWPRLWVKLKEGHTLKSLCTQHPRQFGTSRISKPKFSVHPVMRLSRHVRLFYVKTPAGSLLPHIKHAHLNSVPQKAHRPWMRDPSKCWRASPDSGLNPTYRALDSCHV